MNTQQRLEMLEAALEKIIQECGVMAVTDEPIGTIEKVSYTARKAIEKARVEL